jgi:hypothetical protein
MLISRRRKIMAKIIRPEWLNTKLMHTLRRDEDGEKTVEMNHPTLDEQRRRINA